MNAVTIDRDARLVEALRRQDAGATEALIAAYGDRAYRLAMSIVNDRFDAEEILQDAFWAVVRKIDGFRGESAFGSWLYRIVANRAYEKLRGRRARSQEFSLDAIAGFVDEHGAPAEDWSGHVEDPVVQWDLRLLLTAAITALPQEYRTIVTLRDVDGLSTREISEITGLSIPSVKSRAHRARLVLRKRLADYFADQPVAVGA
jgi:RNA polymerase sigma-70 factor (ECF subfamily)